MGDFETDAPDLTPDIEDHASKSENPVPDHLADREFGESRAHDPGIVHISADWKVNEPHLPFIGRPRFQPAVGLARVVPNKAQSASKG